MSNKSLVLLIVFLIVFMAGVAQGQKLFVPVTPCRVADTRNASGPFGGPAIAGGTARSFVIPSSACGIPSDAAAYSLNVTAVPRAGLGYLTVWPTGVTQPGVSTLNSDGRTKANAAIVPAGTGGAISVYASDPTDLVLDINGYFVSSNSPSALAFYTLSPCRVADTRNATGPLGGPFLAAMQTRAFPILSSSCNVPSSAQAYSLNVTAVPPTGLGYLSAWPTGQTWPGVSTLNAPPTVVANAAIVPAGSNGAINLQASSNTDVVIDINGYFAPASSGSGGLSLYTVTPCRTLDTRNSTGAFTGTLDIDIVGGPCGVGTAAEAFVMNATVVPEGGLGYMTLWPEGAAEPTVSTLNANDGVIASNAAIVPTTNGGTDAYASSSTQLVLDITGYFAPIQPVSYDLQIVTNGKGSGTFSSSPRSTSGCGTGCYTYPAGTTVVLTAAPNTGSVFAGWSGLCSGTGTCTIDLNSNEAVTATFNLPATTNMTWNFSANSSCDMDGYAAIYFRIFDKTARLQWPASYYSVTSPGTAGQQITCSTGDTLTWGASTCSTLDCYYWGAGILGIESYSGTVACTASSSPVTVPVFKCPL